MTQMFLFSSLSKEHLSLGLNVSLNEKNEVIIYAINPNGTFQTTKIKKGDISVSNKKETYIVSCATIESIATMILSSTNKTINTNIEETQAKISTLQLRNN
jgi:carboxyl-terminal processing protease